MSDFDFVDIDTHMVQGRIYAFDCFIVKLMFYFALYSKLIFCDFWRI